MRMLLLHGRKDPNQDMDNWGFQGNTIENIKAVHYTYGDPNVFFESKEIADKYHKLTGWPYFDDNALEMQFYKGELVAINDGNEVSYYGDWELQG